MFLKKNVLFVFWVGFFIVVFAWSGFAESVEPEPAAQADTGIIEESPGEKAKVIPADYQPVELVREFGRGIFTQSGKFIFSPDNKTVYVSDPPERRILAFNMQGDLLFSFGELKSEYRARRNEGEEEAVARKKGEEEENRNRFSSLAGMGIDAKGNVYAADFGSNEVKVFTLDGKFILAIPLVENLQKGSPGNGASGVAINSRGDIYITDSANGRIQVNDINGKYKYQIVKFKDKAGKELALVGPVCPVINSLDEVCVLDPLVCRVHRFNTKGGYMGSFGYMGDGAGGFNAPNGLAVDKLDRVYVTDRASGIVQVFSRQGKFLYALCDEKGKRLEVSFVNGINIDNDGLIYVSMRDSKEYYVKVFKYLAKTAK